jgi:hypothetical protein
LPSDDEHYAEHHAELLTPQKNSRLKSTNTTGYTGVSKSGSEKFRAQIRIKHKQINLGRFSTAKEAALAFDRAIVHHGFLSSRLNFPGGLPKDDDEYEALMNPNKKRRLAPANTSGYSGVYKRGRRFRARIGVGGKRKSLGTYSTPKEAAVAYDRAVVQHKLSSDKLNFPAGPAASSLEDSDGGSDGSDEEDSDSGSEEDSDGGSDEEEEPSTQKRDCW